MFHKSTLFYSLLIFLVLSSARGETLGHNEKCDQAKNVTTVKADGTTTIDILKDNCDESKFLFCREDRCSCKDLKNTIYSGKEFKEDDHLRSRRSPGKKKGIGKGTAIGGGVVAGIAGYQLGKLASGSSSSSSHNHHEEKEKKVMKYSCYTRVNSPCALNPNQVRIISKMSTDENGTTVNEEITIDYRKIYSECVQNAECKEAKAGTVTVKIVNGTVVSEDDGSPDKNIGKCVCIKGYFKTGIDTCTRIRKKSSGTQIALSKYAALFFLLSYLAAQ